MPNYTNFQTMDRSRAYRRNRISSAIKGKNSQAGPSASALTYKGPIVSKEDKMNSNTLCVPLRQMYAITSSAGGVINNTFSIDNPSGSSNFSTYDQIFDEYRVLSSEISFEPINQYNNTNFVPPIAVVLDRDGSSALTGFNEAVGYADFQMKNLSKPFKKTYQMDGTREAVFETTASPSSTGSFLIYAGGLADSTAYGYIIQTWRVQFRGTI